MGARQRLRLGGEFENETSNCCQSYKAQEYVAESYVAPPHPTEEADTIRPHHPPHTTTTGGAGGIPYHPPGGGELLGLQNTPSPWGWGGSSSLQSYIYIYIQESSGRTVHGLDSTRKLDATEGIKTKRTDLSRSFQGGTHFAEFNHCCVLHQLLGLGNTLLQLQIKMCTRSFGYIELLDRKPS